MKTCPPCSIFAPDSEDRCPKCGAELKPCFDPPAATEHRKASSNVAMLLLGVAAIGAIATVVVSMDSPSRTSSGTTTAATPPARAPLTDPPCEEAGQICAIKSDGSSEGVLAPTSLRAFGELQKAAHANDRDGIALMGLRGEVIRLRQGDTVRVLDVSVVHERIEGRVASGEHRGARVWLPSAWLRRSAL